MIELSAKNDVLGNMKRCSMILICLQSAICFAQQPNVLLVIADDLGLDPVPNYLPGPEKANMPNLEALMASGLTFDNVWADPLCSPTRATILTGRYGLRTGVLNANTESLLPSTETTLHRYLDDNTSGYSSSIIGKWHLGGPPGYPNFLGIPYYAGLRAGAVADYNVWTLTLNGTDTPRTDYITTAITDLGIQWIGQQTEPWFCWLAYTAPHVPFHLPPLEMHNQGALPTDQASIDADPLPYFIAMVESLDYEMGRLLATLSPAVRANTVVIFIGDNGTDRNVIQSPYGMLQGKGTLFEGGVRVPLVISGPGVSRVGQRETALVNSSDLFTTIVELTGHALPNYYDSHSLVPMLSQVDLSVRDCLYAEVSDNTDGSTYRNGRYKRIQHANGNEFFYDLLLDPFENNNLLSGTLTTEQEMEFNALVASCDLQVGIRDVPLNSFAIHPDPVSTILTVTHSFKGRVAFTIRSTSGALVATGTIKSDKHDIDVGFLPAGCYLFGIGDQRKRFVKQP